MLTGCTAACPADSKRKNMKSNSKYGKKLFVSIVIPTYNGKSVLGACIQSILRMDYPRNKYEIIVVDNNSSDGTEQFLKKYYPNVKIIKNANNMGYVAINVAV